MTGAWLDLKGDIMEEFHSFDAYIYDRNTLIFSNSLRIMVPNTRIGWGNYHGKTSRPIVIVPPRRPDPTNVFFDTVEEIIPGRPRGRPVVRLLTVAAFASGVPRYELAVRYGICVKCERRTPRRRSAEQVCDKDTHRCDFCLEYARTIAARKAARRKKQGQCVDCGRWSGHGTYRCGTCKDQKNQAAKARHIPKPSRTLTLEQQAGLRVILLEMRDEHGSWRVLADAMGVSLDALSRTNKRGRSITREHARWIANFKHIDLETLLSSLSVERARENARERQEKQRLDVVAAFAKLSSEEQKSALASMNELYRESVKET